MLQCTQIGLNSTGLGRLCVVQFSLYPDLCLPGQVKTYMVCT